MLDCVWGRLSLIFRFICLYFPLTLNDNIYFSFMFCSHAESFFFSFFFHVHSLINPIRDFPSSYIKLSCIWCEMTKLSFCVCVFFLAMHLICVFFFLFSLRIHFMIQTLHFKYHALDSESIFFYAFTNTYSLDSMNSNVDCN